MSPLEQAPGSGSLRPGYVFAGRYRLVNRIGRGDRGAVWRADDLVLQTPVALKLVDQTRRNERFHILNEVRLARQITHPAVCRVFDVGEAEDKVFYSMQLVRGEDLATLLRRAGRLPSEKVLEIGRQLCGGLAAIHAHGVVHGNLKPANVLVDEDGSVRMTDTGFGQLRDDTIAGNLVGSTDYLAPEQLATAGSVSPRSDLYALGLILYELVAGVRPIGDRSIGLRRPGLLVRPSRLVADIDPRLDRVIAQALAVNPRHRPASAEQMADTMAAAVAPALAEAMSATMSVTTSATTAATTANVVAGTIADPAAESIATATTTRRPGAVPDVRRERRWWLAATAAAAATILAAIGTLSFWHGTRVLTDQDTIVLADFTNTTGESVFDGTLKVALAVALEQSPFLKVFPDDRLPDVLRLMERAPDQRVTRSLAREIARREQLKALVAGSIGGLGSHYVIALEAINAETGDVMARQQIEAASKEEVITALGTVSSKLREQLGESLASIEKFDVPLPRATTASLAALHAYSLALDQGRISTRVEAIPHLKRAIELDPDFALAQALLSGVYTNIGQSSEAPALSRRAFELRDRVSERERFLISWRYYVDALQAWDQALELSRSWTASYPREAFAFNSLGLASAAFGQHDEAVRAFREAIRLDPGLVPPRRNLTGSLIALNRFEEARTTLHEATAAGIDSIGIGQMEYLLAFLANDPPALAGEPNLARGSGVAMWSSNSEARTALFSGRFRTAHELFQRSVQEAVRENFRELGARWMLEDAESHAIAGQCVEARQEVASGLELGRDNFTLERASRTLAFCDAAGEASILSMELANRFPNATLVARIQLPVIAASLAVRRGDARRAVELLDPIKSYDRAPAAEFWPGYLRGVAYLQAKDGRAAGVEFQTILDHRGEAPTSPLYPLAQLGLGRAAALAGEVEQARKAYRSFLALWSSADSTLRPVADARAEYARLQ